MKPATASADNGAFSVQKTIFRPEGISIRFGPENSFLVLYGANGFGQDCARPAIASDFFQKSLAQGLVSVVLRLKWTVL